MHYSPSIQVKPFTFYTIFPQSIEEPHYIISQQRLDVGANLFIEDYPPASKIHTLFSVYQVGLDGYVSEDAQHAGYVLYSKYPSNNWASSVLACAEAQRPMISELKGVTSRLVLRTSLFYLFNMENVGTLACNSRTSSKIHDTLTSV